MAQFPIDAIRARFPALAADALFLDNPAGTQVPDMVIEAVAGAMANCASNLGGFFRASKDAEAIYDAAHDGMADFLGAESGREILIGQSMSMLTFQISRSLGRRWREGDEVVVTHMDHEGNISPWLRLAEEKGLVIRWLGFNRDSWRIEPEELKPLLNERTRLVALNYASNNTGSINPAAELTAMARDAGALVYLDAVQFAPHCLVDVQGLGCDFLVCSSYKFFGPHLGVLWGREAILGELYPYAVRCAPKDLPGRHDVGTTQTEMFAGLAATADYFAWLGERCGASGDRRAKIAGAYAAATAYEMPLAQKLIEGVRAIPGVTVHGITNSNRMHERVPTVSITHARHKSAALAEGLAQKRINVWSGHNYAPEVVRWLGLDETDGLLRIGLAHYNTEAEVERVLQALQELATS